MQLKLKCFQLRVGDWLAALVAIETVISAVGIRAVRAVVGLTLGAVTLTAGSVRISAMLRSGKKRPEFSGT